MGFASAPLAGQTVTTARPLAGKSRRPDARLSDAGQSGAQPTAQCLAVCYVSRTCRRPATADRAMRTARVSDASARYAGVQEPARFRPERSRSCGGKTCLPHALPGCASLAGRCNGICPVAPAVMIQPICQYAFRLLRSRRQNAEVLLYKPLMILHRAGQGSRRVRRAGKDHHATGRRIQPMNQPYRHSPSQHRKQVGLTARIRLRRHTGRFLYKQDFTVLIQDPDIRIRHIHGFASLRLCACPHYSTVPAYCQWNPEAADRGIYSQAVQLRLPRAPEPSAATARITYGVPVCAPRR